ncbi:hypothetical protein [Paenibacillus graminis]|uniref:hypothetical protein n=1 Tax=Paenibacillus graminis TaxID=189425 RepID=UPI002DB68C11|nr:hypothetical protein [Paenibacillus graminis]MEC0171673.1 hypothetical protein [Paenibacillus graminis]
MKLIDGNKLIEYLEYLQTVAIPGSSADKPEYARRKNHMVHLLTNLIISGAFDPTTPVEPDNGEVINDGEMD